MQARENTVGLAANLARIYVLFLHNKMRLCISWDHRDPTAWMIQCSL